MVSHLETYRRSLGIATLVGGLVVVAWLLLPSPAQADTVYLKNGRVLIASHVEVLEDEGRVVLHQGTNRVVIPLSIVDRIVEDDDGGAAALPEPGTAEPVREPAPTEPAETAEGEPEAAGEGEADEVTADAARTTRAYWQDAVRAIGEERSLLQGSLAELRREERAFLFSHRSTAETKAKIEAVQQRLADLDTAMETLRREARREGIPPGWLRVGSGPQDTRP